MEFLTELKRTHNNGALRGSDTGNEVVLMGWVQARRDHGGCTFIDLRDRDGITQLRFDPTINQEAYDISMQQTDMAARLKAQLDAKNAEMKANPRGWK